MSANSGRSGGRKRPKPPPRTAANDNSRGARVIICFTGSALPVQLTEVEVFDLLLSRSTMEVANDNDLVPKGTIEG